MGSAIQASNYKGRVRRMPWLKGLCSPHLGTGSSYPILWTIPAITLVIGRPD